MNNLSSVTLATLRVSGWERKRRADTTQWRTEIESDGFVFHSAGQRFLEEFGGLASWGGAKCRKLDICHSSMAGGFAVRRLG